MKNYFYVLIVTFLFSCSEKEIIGPDLESLGNSPVVKETLTVSDNSVDFPGGETVYFSAAFEKDVVWKLTLTGHTSLATKTFTGAGSVVNVSNTLWSGGADNPPGFIEETVTAALTFPNFPSTPLLSVDFYIENPAGTSDGVLVTDFQTSKAYCVCGPAPAGGGWPSDWPATVNNNTAYNYPDGNSYMYMSGTPWQANNPYVDFMTITPAQADQNYGTYFPLYVNASQVYFNIMVYNTGAEDTWLQVNFKEENGATRNLNIRPDWIGWKLVSVKYSDLTSASAAAPTPDKIIEITFLLLSDENLANDPLSEVSVAFDHPIFTHDLPFQP